MLGLIDIARLEEERLASAIRELADESRTIGGGGGGREGPHNGLAGRGRPGTWVNMAAGVGMRGPVTREELEAVAAWYQEAGIEPRFEVCPYAHSTVVEHLGGLGFMIRHFDSVLFRELSGELPPRPELSGPIRIGVVDPDDQAAVLDFAEVTTRNFLPPGVTLTEAGIELNARAVRHPRVVTIAAWADGRIVGGGGVEVYGQVGTLFGLAVAPEYRRRGIQSTIMWERLKIARERGAAIATIGARPGVEVSPTERNARRLGFQVAYTKVVLVRPGAGLKGAIG